MSSTGQQPTQAAEYHHKFDDNNDDLMVRDVGTGVCLTMRTNSKAVYIKLTEPWPGSQDLVSDNHNMLFATLHHLGQYLSPVRGSSLLTVTRSQGPLQDDVRRHTVQQLVFYFWYKWQGICMIFARETSCTAWWCAHFITFCHLCTRAIEPPIGICK